MVGEERWKANVNNTTSGLGSCIAEAYAHELLQNNYFAWVLEYKIRMSTRDHQCRLKTAYDTPTADDDDIGEELYTAKELRRFEFVKKTESDTEGYEMIDSEEDQERYDEAKEDRIDKQRVIGVDARGDEGKHKRACSAMNDAFAECRDLSLASEQDTSPDKGKESRKKKRKIMKSIKAHSGNASVDVGDGGHPTAAMPKHKFLFETKLSIMKDNRAGTRKSFEESYRQWMTIAKNIEDKENTTNKVKPFKVDCDVMYEPDE